jgi:hypothetical protein
VLIVLIVLVSLRHTQPAGYESFDDEYYAPASIGTHGLESTTRREYVPRWVQTPLQYTGVGLISPDSRLSTRLLSSRSTTHVYLVAAPAAVTVMESTAYYPGWTVLIDGHETSITSAPNLGLISFQVPAGQHTITVVLQPTEVRRFASLVSLLSLAALLLAAIADCIHQVLEDPILSVEAGFPSHAYPEEPKN